MNNPTTDLSTFIRTIPDYPRPGILFRDITTLLSDADAFQRAVDALVTPWKQARISLVAGIEARGFILGGALAHQLNVGFIPLRKRGKLPYTTVRMPYALEYGTDELEMHADAIQPGARILLVDDLIATGGTATAAVKLIRLQGGQIMGATFVIDLPDLGGAQRLRDLDVQVSALMDFPGH